MGGRTREKSLSFESWRRCSSIGASSAADVGVESPCHELAPAPRAARFLDDAR